MKKDPGVFVDHMLEGNVIRHDYHDTYPTVPWETCAKDLQPLKIALARIRSMIAQHGNE